MIVTVILALLTPLVATTAASGQDRPVRVAGLDLGPHWYGKPVNDRGELKGQVVLFLMWGTCSSCNKVTPDLIKLARRLENRPFRIVAAHSQQSTRERVATYVRSLGLAENTPNFTITDFGSHPRVETSGFVPYYIVFDHHGNLAHHHTAGNDHGGDGRDMYRWVDRLVKAAPAIYLGESPFTHLPELAAAVAEKKRFPGSVLEIEKRLAAGPDAATRAELDRLLTAIRAYRDHQMETVTRDLVHAPDRVLPRLRRLSRELADTSLAADVDPRLQSLEGSEVLAASRRLHDNMRKVRLKLEKRKACKSCRGMGIRKLQPDCSDCRAAHPEAFAKAEKQLERLVEAHPDLPITARVRAYLQALAQTEE